MHTSLSNPARAHVALVTTARKRHTHARAHLCLLDDPREVRRHDGNDERLERVAVHPNLADRLGLRVDVLDALRGDVLALRELEDVLQTVTSSE